MADNGHFVKTTPDLFFLVNLSYLPSKHKTQNSSTLQRFDNLQATRNVHHKPEQLHINEHKCTCSCTWILSANETKICSSQSATSVINVQVFCATKANFSTQILVKLVVDGRVQISLLFATRNQVKFTKLEL